MCVVSHTKVYSFLNFLNFTIGKYVHHQCMPCRKLLLYGRKKLLLFKHNSRLLLNNIYMKNLKELCAVITKIMFLK